MKLSAVQEQKIQALLDKMTLEEKIGQLNQASVSIVGGFDVPFGELIEMMTDGRLSQDEFHKIMATSEKDYHEEEIKQGLVGSMMVQDPETSNRLQKIAVEESRLGIPLIIGLDVIHGYKTVVPIALAEAGSFDRDLMKRTAQMAAKESRADGIHWHFAPMLDISRDARWGRVSEGGGEDPYLLSQFAKAKIEGLQNDQSSHLNYVAACLKHYVGYGACEGGRDYNTVSMSESLLRNVYLPPFRAAIDAGATTVMAAFNDLNGVPCTVNREMLTDKLREEFGFDGFVVSDANAIRECVAHGIVSDEAEAGAKALYAGLDMDMGTEIYLKTLKDSLASGTISIETVDQAVERILRVKMWLGLFDHPYVELPESDDLSEDNKALALEAAEKSIVLLKNKDDLLPLPIDTKISIIGELANKASEVSGAWAISFREKDGVSLVEGITKEFPNSRYFEVGGLETPINEAILQEALAYGDVIILVAGELVSMSGEATSRADISLPGEQSKLFAALEKLDKPTVAILMNGRPMAIEKEVDQVDAVIESWHLGIQMGHAVARTLSGANNPSARLTVSFPRVSGQCPVYYNHPNTGRPAGRSKFTSKYMDIEPGALYDFGYGLSYSRFAFENVVLKETAESIQITLDVSNISDRDGEEVIQLYMTDKVTSLVRPVKELKGFEKVKVASKEKVAVELRVDKKDLGFWNNQGQYCLEDGDFVFTVTDGNENSESFELNLSF
ncbi:glycoside hydrolase family 3 N-terminal domain-containing protein [Streptococcus sp. S784/96/1]|uniref:glycoside hydrolase family 3 N-terminal domain-containing protein n=2 Tax=Streptococcus sp. S784/96/1 TaxID=2653499 RepID=UPI001386F2D1|nr:glycoside hydrolase family 3 N-terminal domain-containing protein [Streptococcus sp. S784/96/1]